jgi:small-conductance mechanosensitive channel
VRAALAGLADFFFSPQKWGHLDELPLAERIVFSSVVIGLALVAALAIGTLLGRWAHRRSGAALGSLVDDRIKRFRRSVYVSTALWGVYVSVEALPLPPRVSGFLAGLVYVGASYAAMRALAHLVTLLFLSSVSRIDGENRDRLMREYVPLVSKAVGLVGWLLLISVVAKHFGRDVSSLVAALGVGSLAIGLAAQQTLGNMIGGFVVLVDRPFRPGDRIRLATGETGDVLDIGIRSTRIKLLTGNLLIVPNAELANSRVVNLISRGGSVTVWLAHTADVPQALAALGELAVADERICKEPPPSTTVAQINDLGIEVSLSFTVASGEREPVEAALRSAIVARFSKDNLRFASRAAA